MPAKIIEYRNYSKFSPEALLHELDQELNKGIIYNKQDKQYNLLPDIFRTILDHHAPLKTKRIIHSFSQSLFTLVILTLKFTKMKK